MSSNVIITKRDKINEVNSNSILGFVYHLGELVEIHFNSVSEAERHRHLSIPSFSSD